MKKGDKLICKENVCYDSNSNEYFLTKGKLYELVTNVYIDYFGDNVVDFIDDNNEPHSWEIKDIYSIFYKKDELRKRKLQSI